MRIRTTACDPDKDSPLVDFGLPGKGLETRRLKRMVAAATPPAGEDVPAVVSDHRSNSAFTMVLIRK